MIIAWDADREASGGGGATADLLGTPPGSNAVGGTSETAW
jgi:hypothetical protein